jgi:hypothetical protein
MTAWNLWRLSMMEQLMFFLLKVSEAAPKMATSWAPAARADSKPKNPWQTKNKIHGNKDQKSMTIRIKKIGQWDFF